LPRDPRHRTLIALLAAAITVLAACTPSAGVSWTMAPDRSAAPSADTGSPAPSTPAASPAPSGRPTAGRTPTATGYTEKSSEPCPNDSRFTCVTLTVPKDHFGPPDGPTWDVTYAVQRAAKARLGTFVVITGGPGSSGISVADSYTDVYPASITDNYDIVYLDQRGIGLSGPIQCVDAAATYYASTARAQDRAQRDAVADAARTFAADCIAEAGVAEEDLPLYASTQAIEDLEAVRAHLGAEQLHLYGESYGTQFSQLYAAAHPDRVAALFLDGPVDLALEGIPYYIEAARSAEDTLTSALRDCAADDVCAADTEGGDALAAYDALRERLATGPISFDFPTATGETIRRELTETDLENAAFGYSYSPGDRSALLRAIAAASNGNYVPLARVAYDSIGIDPETLAAEEDPTWSDAMYYAVECQDYSFYPMGGSPDERLDAWLADGADSGINGLRMGTSFYGDLPCLYWPTATTRTDRPAPIVDPPYTTFVLTSTTDPATPIANGMRIYSRLADAYFLQTLGGPHVIFGWGVACPDEVIGAYLGSGTLPDARVVTCEGDVADAFLPLPEEDAGDYRDALAVTQSLDDQIFSTNDYGYRLEDEPLTMGCDAGGTLTYTPTDVGTDVSLAGCAFTPGLAFTGTGSADDEAGTFELDVDRGGDSLHYERDAEGGVAVTGRYGGSPVDLER
jgi:pimeloyl-ACP methyl ester carboxylesterase